MHPQPPAQARTDWKTVFQKLGGAVIPVVTLGAGSPVMFGILAVRRRSFRLAASAGVYLATAVAFWASGWEDVPDSTRADVIVISLLLSIVAASVQAAVVIGGPRVVNLNEAPAGVLSALPGLNFRIAAAIVASRDQAGRFRSVDELWSRGLLPVPPGPELLERLVVTAVQDRR